MMIPNVIKIGGRDVAVKREMLEPGLLGMFQPDIQTITLSSSITDPNILGETFFHELMHAIHDYLAVQVQLERALAEAENDGVMPQDGFNLEENITERMGSTLFQIFKDNQIAV